MGVLGVRRLFVCSEEQNPGVVVSLRSCRAAGSEAELQAGRSAAALPPSGAPYSGVPGLDWGLRGDGAPEPPVGSSQLSSGTENPPHEGRSLLGSPKRDEFALLTSPGSSPRAPTAEAAGLWPYSPGCWPCRRPQTWLQHRSRLPPAPWSRGGTRGPRGNRPWGRRSRWDPRPRTGPRAGRPKRPGTPRTWWGRWRPPEARSWAGKAAKK